MPFIEAQIRVVQPNQTTASDRPVRVLDAACGTGMHAIELARRGYQVSGADLSAGMIARAVENAREAGVEVDFRAAGFGELSSFYSEFRRPALPGKLAPPSADAGRAFRRPARLCRLSEPGWAAAGSEPQFRRCAGAAVSAGWVPSRTAPPKEIGSSCAFTISTRMG